MAELVSVIVPIYKVEDTLTRCVNSILGQTYYNLEIILVDDGSPDSCGLMCDQYAREDERITVIHKRNGGLSSARNAGLDNCHGEYITFVDSDDWISENCISEMLRILKENDADISIIDTICVLENGKKLDGFSHGYRCNSLYSNTEALDVILNQCEFETSAWAKLYNRTVFNNLRFTEGILYEDLDIMYRLLDRVKTVSFSDAAKYFYFQRNESIMHQKYSPKDNILLSIADDMLRYVNEHFPKLKDSAVRRYVISQFMILKKTEFKKGYSDTINIIFNNLQKLQGNVYRNKKLSVKEKIKVFLFLHLWRRNLNE